MNHRKIAEIAHVSTSTVSKALSGSNEISEAVANEIRRIAWENGYYAEKNKIKTTNNRKNGANIAVICPEIISIYYSKIVTLLKSFIDERGGRTAVYIYDFDKSKLEELVQSLSMDKTTDGIILISSHKFSKAPFVPLVSIDSFGNNNNNNFSIGVDMFAVLDDIVRHLTEHGHKKIGFVGEANTRIKEKCFRNSFQKFNLEINESYIYNIEKRFEYIGSDAAKEIIASKDRPSAIVTAYDEVAVSLIYNLEKAGIKVPEDISVVGMNDIPLAPYIKTSLTTVRFDFDEQAALAVDILYDKIYSVNDTMEHMIVNHELVVRDSVSYIK